MSMGGMSNPKFLVVIMIVTSFILVIDAWALIWVYKKRNGDKVPFTSLWIAKESNFISMQLAVLFVMLGLLVVAGVLMIRSGKLVFELTIVMDILIHLLLFTLAIWCCFLAKEKVEVYLNYVYKANDGYSRIQILLLYTILAALFSLLVI
jgi:hypothetical protein